MITLAPQPFDGVICFGGVDWWYHNRGHYDLRLTRLIAKDMPVLYVNSLGMRVPSAQEGSMFLRRVARKANSFSKGLREVEPNFHVLTPAYIPGGKAEPYLRSLLLRQVRLAARKIGIKNPLIWVACPTAARIAFELTSAGVLFQRTDHFEAFDKGASSSIRRDCELLLANADMTVYCSSDLMGADTTGKALFVDHGVDFDAFAEAGAVRGNLPPGLERLSRSTRPRVGFVGGLDAHTFDLELFLNVANSLPLHDFVLVGSDTYPPGTFMGSNIFRVPRVLPEQVPSYLAACDALIMPWNRSPWIEGCNPIKLKEYLAVGRPIVSTPFRELTRYEGLVNVAYNEQQFSNAVYSATSGPFDPGPGQARVKSESWSAKLGKVLNGLATVGIISAYPAFLFGRKEQEGKRWSA